MIESTVIKWFDASPNCYMVLDRELQYVAANKAYLEATGSTAKQLLGRNIFELFPNDPEDASNQPRRLLEGSLKRVLATGKRDVLAYIPYRVARTPGAEPELRIWSATHTPLFDDDGEVEAVLQYTEDVTSLYGASSAANVLSRAEQVQRDYVELGERLRTLVTTLDQAPGFMAVLRGPEHVLEFTNRAYDSLIGGRPVVGRSIREAIPELAGQGYLEILDRVFAEKEPFLGRGMRVELYEPDGERHESYVDFVYQPIVGPDGETYGVLVQGHDITEQVRASRHAQFRTLASEHIAAADGDIEATLRDVAWSAVETVADWAIVDLFEDGRNRRLVAAHADPSRESEAEALREHALPQAIPQGHLLHELGKRPHVVPRLTPQLLRQSATSPQHLQLLEGLGLQSMLSVPLWHRDRLYGVLVLLTAQSRRRYDETDVAPMVELAGVLSTAFDNMRLAREREALLRTTEEARERAETASRAKDDFLAVLGHELRNPLAPILTAVDLLRLDELAPERELSIIEGQARHLVRLVDDMLDVSRIVHGKFELRCAPVVVGAFVGRAVEMASSLIEQRNHELVVTLGAGDASVYGDEARLSQVIANLLTNAARYTPEAGRISLTTCVEGEDVVVRVVDDGAGIEASILPRVFDMFVQGPQSTERSQGGLGLGLTLVKRLVELHGGSVGAHSRGVGEGSEFSVRLPAHRDEQRSPQAREPELGSGVSESHVLVVDDNEDAAGLLAALLGRSGHTVQVCHDGHTALSHILEAPPDVAIVDIGLPGMDGLELARRVRQALGARAPRLLALTGYGSAEDKQSSRRAGFDAHLTKPVDVKTVLDSLRAHPSLG